MLWQRVIVDDRPAIITGYYYTPLVTALKLNEDCCGWQYAVNYLEVMPTNSAISYCDDPMEFINEEAIKVENASR